MDIDLFNRPKEHPFGMLEGYKHALEKEVLLARILTTCVNAGSWEIVETAFEHPTMVQDGLLEQHGPRQYSLTEKAKGLLYAHFHKEN